MSTYIVHAYDTDDRHSGTVDREFATYAEADAEAQRQHAAIGQGVRFKALQGTLNGDEPPRFIRPTEPNDRTHDTHLDRNGTSLYVGCTVELSNGDTGEVRILEAIAPGTAGEREGYRTVYVALDGGGFTVERADMTTAYFADEAEYAERGLRGE